MVFGAQGSGGPFDSGPARARGHRRREWTEAAGREPDRGAASGHAGRQARSRPRGPEGARPPCEPPRPGPAPALSSLDSLSNASVGSRPPARPLLPHPTSAGAAGAWVEAGRGTGRTRGRGRETQEGLWADHTGRRPDRGSRPRDPCPPRVPAEAPYSSRSGAREGTRPGSTRGRPAPCPLATVTLKPPSRPRNDPSRGRDPSSLGGGPVHVGSPRGPYPVSVKGMARVASGSPSPKPLTHPQSVLGRYGWGPDLGTQVSRRRGGPGGKTGRTRDSLPHSPLHPCGVRESPTERGT